jgi:lipopolysaccharide biosynthesis regulator YciM
VELQQVRDEAARARFDALVVEASEKGNQAELAEHYFNESARLERELGRERERADRLQEQVANLSQALQHLPNSAVSADEIAPEPAFTVTSIEDAVVRAADVFQQDLVFGRDVSEGIATVLANAGPPDKIFEYLKTLAEMAQQRRSAGLGKDMILWLKEHGLKASAESQTVVNSAAEMQKRTWDDGRGTRRRFEKHLKPKDGTSPDQCVRIYFDYDEAIRKAVVGWVGRHP